MELSPRDYAVLSAISDLPADRGTFVSRDAILDRLSANEAEDLGDSLKRLEVMKFVALDDNGSAEITDQGAAALASL